MSNAALVDPVLTLPDFQPVDYNHTSDPACVLPRAVVDTTDLPSRAEIHAVALCYSYAAHEYERMRADYTLTRSPIRFLAIERGILRTTAVVDSLYACAQMLDGTDLRACVHYRAEYYSVALLHANLLHRELLFEIADMKRVKYARTWDPHYAATLFVTNPATRLSLIRRWVRYAHARAAECAAEMGSDFLCMCRTKHQLGSGDFP
jgi:hypothetical protein